MTEENLNLEKITLKLRKLVEDYIKEVIDNNPNLPQEIQKFPDYGLKNYQFKIGNVLLKNPVVSAPLAGISDNSYRIFTKAFGAALTFTEMVTSYGIYYNHKNSLELAEITEYERPCAVQIFGSNPDIMTEAAKRIEHKADVIDINMGCPVAKVLKSKSGGYLLQDEKKIEAIVSKVVSAASKPVTIKARIGWDKSSINICRVAEIAEAGGASAITIHGRTVKQGFSGDIDYEIIRQVKNKVKIPVIVSGDIDSSEKARWVLDYTGCDALMIGRASKGNPWIFFNVLVTFICNENLNACILNNDCLPSIELRKRAAELYLRFLIFFKGEEKAVKEFRKYLGWFFRGVRNIGKIRSGFFSIDSYNDVIEVMGGIESCKKY